MKKQGVFPSFKLKKDFNRSAEEMISSKAPKNEVIIER
eukprot:CAMPEP_0114578882 /NCGR_PEP_ID=MMETSP0125-20121206/3365_1 /TAXON_ID=485358 ORGANISM="Aristerostoma sp., Strain ATCC 50986" /NCGR_SAMPLE_ID=MMETSP0125 /ASSEMBLY_ACC=CAM_ASM_000245 /LENGTH=37 /DNA_ID= /DNA_START= /DNA_END= /DNA_ORIENTATION=